MLRNTVAPHLREGIARTLRESLAPQARYLLAPGLRREGPRVSLAHGESPADEPGCEPVSTCPSGAFAGVPAFSVRRC